MFSNVEYTSGEYYEYGNNFTSYHWDQYVPDDNPVFNTSDKEVFLFHTVHEYTAWDDETILGIKTKHTVAVLLLISAILIFVSILSQLREGLDDE